ncbi:MAG: DoxX family protein [Acidimicrobiales bacterium]
MASPLSLRDRILSPRSLAGVFAASGTLHFATPKIFEAIVPRWMPARRTMVYTSGAAELLCAAGLVSDASWAGPASAALLAALWPANVQMALDETRSKRPLLRQLLVWGRVPLQIPMIRVALSARRFGAG